MRGCTSILAAIAAVTSLSLAAPLAAAKQAGKTPLRIDVVERGIVWLGTESSGKGRFALIGASAADSDSGTFTFKYSPGALAKTPDGQSFQPVRHTGTATGKHGKLVLRSVGRQFPVLARLGFFSVENHVLSGTWSIVEGTGRYAGLKGGGAFVATMLKATTGTDEFDFSYRYEGFVTRS